ncbi:hypothetical protein [Chloroflexus sp.]|uniref:hypothetical protein n=1 Tax=Chloroflexus sp. TaxID=1904827 RepID=UPI00261CEA3B|nr:hypothetical protein [uncultured Chloroflexus sp.]
MSVTDQSATADSQRRGRAITFSLVTVNDQATHTVGVAMTSARTLRTVFAPVDNGLCAGTSA